MSNTNKYGNWYETEVGSEIVKKKYCHDGEKTFPDVARRIKNCFPAEIGNKVEKMMLDADFFFGGRALYALGCKGKFVASTSNCFTKGHKVITNRGLLNIEDVVVGDLVITEDGSWQPVNEVMSREYNGDLFEIAVENGYDKVVCTPNHEFLTEVGWRRADRLLASSRRVSACHKIKIPSLKYKKEYSDIDFTEHFNDNEHYELYFENEKVIAKTIKSDGFVSSCGSRFVNRYAVLDSDFRYFIGRWLGDGSVTQRKEKCVPSILQIVFNATNEREAAERCIRIGRDKFGIEPSIRETEQNVIAVRFENAIISSWFKGEFGSKCDGKFIREKYLGDLDIALGLLDSDGCVFTHGAMSITLKNENMLNWLRDTLYLNGINCLQIYKSNKYEGTYSLRIPTGISKGKLLPHLTKSYHDGRIGHTSVKEINSCYTRVSNVRIIPDVATTVYNLSVENVHSYTVNGLIVHNCYVLPSPSDDLESIINVSKEMAVIFSKGGGTGLNLSNLRPRGAKVNNVAKTSTGAVSFMELYNTIGKVISQNGRRGALLIGLNCDHPDIEEFLKIKQDNTSIQSANISILFTDEFMEAVNNHEDYELKFTLESGEVISKTINAFDFFMDFCESNKDYGEPGAIFIDRVRGWHLLSEDEDYKIEISNPCFTGDMRLLTSEGYKTFKELDGKSWNVASNDGLFSVGKVWCSGEKEVIRLKLSNGQVIKCTPNHIFMTADKKQVEAQNFKGQRVMPFLSSEHRLVNNKFEMFGFMQGDGQLTRLNSKSHRGLEVNIGVLDDDVLNKFGATRDDLLKSSRTLYVSGYNEELNNLGFSKEQLPYRKFPTSYNDWNDVAKLSFIRGCYSANGSVLSCGRITYKTTCEIFANQMADALSDFGIDAYLTKNKAKKVLFPNGEYECKESFDVNIQQFESKVKFYNKIGFFQKYKDEKLFNNLIATAPIVRSIAKIGVEKVYDFSEPRNHWGVVEGFVVHNCAEFFAKANNSCNLASLNLYNFVKNPFTNNAEFDFDRFTESVGIAVEAMDLVLDYGYDMQPLDANRKDIDDYRSIGLGIFGLADMFVAMGIRYGSSDSVKLVEKIGKTLFHSALKKSNELAISKGSYKKCKPDKLASAPILDWLYETDCKLLDSIAEYGLRNATLLSVAPTGTIATMSGLSSGVESLYQISYERTTHSLVEEKKYFTVHAKSVHDLIKTLGLKDYSNDELKAKFPYIVDAYDITPFERIAVQSSLQQFVDNAISATINVKEGATKEEIFEIYKSAWDEGCKGITVFVENCKRTCILGKNANPESDIQLDKIKPLKRQERKMDGSTYVGSSACAKKLYVTVNKKDNQVFELFTNTSSGCKSNINVINRLASLAIRSGVEVNEVIGELKSNICPACQTQRNYGNTVSLSCGHCIGEALEEAYSVKAEKKQNLLPCPSCGENTLRPEGKCYTCSACGYSRCD